MIFEDIFQESNAVDETLFGALDSSGGSPPRREHALVLLFSWYSEQESQEHFGAKIQKGSKNGR